MRCTVGKLQQGRGLCTTFWDATSGLTCRPSCMSRVPEHAGRLQQRGKVGWLHLPPINRQAHSVRVTRGMRSSGSRRTPTG